MLVVALVGAGSFVALLEAADADAAVRRSLCAPRANLRDSPRGFIIGRLRRPQRLTVIRRDADRRWTQVCTRTGLVGWLPSGSLCRAR